MDIYECHDRYRITLKKLSRMAHDGVLQIDGPKLPEFWRRVLLDIRKGKMTARSIALAYRFPEKLEKLAWLTPSDRRVIDKHFQLAEIPAELLNLPRLTTAVLGTAEKQAKYTEQLIEALRQIIPARHVTYEYVAVRLMLTCETDYQIHLMSINVAKALFRIRDLSNMKDWWHRQSDTPRKYRIIYHRPEARYDL